MKAEVLTDFPERLAQHKYVYVGPDHTPVQLQGVRMHRGQALLKLAGVDTVEQAENLRGSLVQIRASDAAPLEAEQYYFHQIIGMAVETTGGERLGEVVDVLRTGANDVYVVRSGKGEILLPATEQVVKTVDVAGGRMIVELMPGIVD